MTPFILLLFLSSLLTFVAGQLLLKHAMAPAGQRNASFFTAGIAAMTVSFFITLGLLQRFDLSYVFPFQGLSVIIVTFAASLLLKEKLTLRLTLGALLISAGIVLVSAS